jgi:hypothetical protein
LVEAAISAQNESSLPSGARYRLQTQSRLPEMMIQSPLDATGGLAMRTTILAYVMAIVALALIVAGAWDIYVLSNEQTFEVTLSDYATPIRTIAGGLAMIGLAEALRLLSRLITGLCSGSMQV